MKLEDKISQYFSAETLTGLHHIAGQDYSLELEIYDLLFQTSGLPNYFEAGGLNQLAQTKDYYFTFDQLIAHQ